jgi:molybdenum cofactor synthesis domain-containing protein
MRVAIVTVGDELLSGDTTNTNATWLGQQLTDRGVTVERVTVVPDRIAAIARVVNEHRAEHDAVIVTGGLGPTPDDLTMEAVAAAVGRGLSQNASVSEALSERGYAAEDLTSNTTAIPEGAEPLHNPVGVAPGAVVESIYVLPGVPQEMRAMFGTVADEFAGEPTHTERVVAGEPESQLLDRIDAVHDRFEVAVASYPGNGAVELKVSGRDESEVADAAAWLEDNVVAP